MILINFNWYELVLAVMSLAVHDGQVVKNPSLLGFITPRENPNFEWGSAKILTMEAKRVKTNKRTKSGQKFLKSAKSDYFAPL